MPKLKHYPNRNTIKEEISEILGAYPLTYTNKAHWLIGKFKTCQLELSAHPAAREPEVSLFEFDLTPFNSSRVKPFLGTQFIILQSGIIRKVVSFEYYSEDKLILPTAEILPRPEHHVQAAINLNSGIENHTIIDR